MGRKTKQNKITSPELIAQINPKNKRLMKDFLDYLRSVGKAETTIKAYTSDLNIFFVWALQNTDNKHFPEIAKRANLPDSAIKTIIGWEGLEMLKIYKDIDGEEEIGKFFKDGEIVGAEQSNLSDLYDKGVALVEKHLDRWPRIRPDGFCFCR